MIWIVSSYNTLFLDLQVFEDQKPNPKSNSRSHEVAAKALLRTDPLKCLAEH